MNQPFLSCICVTYGRPAHLEEAIASFLGQTYDGPRELIVLNTYPKQKLLGEFPNVRIINLDERPASLGQARNAAIELAQGTHILTWDDDDLYLPNHLGNFARHFGELDWLWFQRQFYSTFGEIKNVVQGSCNILGFTKSAWRDLGGYPAIGCGEDRRFISQLASRKDGAKVPLTDEELSFIYCWGNGLYHASGLGDDVPGKPTTHERVEAELNSRVSRGLIKNGNVTLNPHWSRNYAADAAAFIGKHARIKHEAKSVCIVQLGRFGDIINILPVAKHIHDTYGKPYLLCSREFSSVLEGVSYVEPYPVDLRSDQLKEALIIARKQFRHVLQAQIWGNEHLQEKLCPSFNMEQWRMLGFLHKFWDEKFQLVFDQQNTPRALAAYHKARLMPEKSLLLVNVTRSHSSPYGAGKDLLARLHEAFDETHEVMDVSHLVLERLYDLIPFMEHATAIATIDTAILHLAACTTTPVVALVNPNPWLGSTPRYTWGLTLDYHQAAADPDRVISVLKLALNQERPQARPTLRNHAPERTIFHVIETGCRVESSKEMERKLKARESWKALYDAKEMVPVHVDNLPRNAMYIGDVRPLPYLKDVLKVAMELAENDDIIVFTNDDIYLHRSLPDFLHLHVALHEACCAQRCEFVDRDFPPDNAPIEYFAAQGKQHMGRDLFAFTKRWLLNHWDEIPDYIIGASEYDLGLAALIRIDQGVESTRENLEHIIPPFEIPRGYIAHQFHKPRWSEPGYVNRAPSQLWNRKLLQDWAAKKLPNLPFGSDGTIAWHDNQRTIAHSPDVITVRRSGSLGDAVAALCVVDALIAQGHRVVFKAHPSCHPLLRRHAGLLGVQEAAGPADVDLDGAYETDPRRTERHFAAMFIERANKHLAKRKIVLPPAVNFAPRLGSLDYVRAQVQPILEAYPRPWVMICPRSQSFINRTVPVNIWRDAAANIQGTKFWLGNDKPPPGIEDLQCRHVDLLAEFIGLADLIVTVDTGPLHIAAAMGVPAVAIHQSSSPELHLSDQRDWMMIEPDLDCLNCQKAICPIHPKFPPCQNIPTAMISEAANARLRARFSEDVSAVIAVYKPNIARLNRCLYALLPQVQEVVIASDLDTPWPLNGLIQDPKIRVVRKLAKNTGYGRKANFGARHSNGKYLFMVNDDVFLEPNVVESLRAEMQNSVAMVTHLLRYPNGTIQYAGKYRPTGAVGFGHIDHRAANSRFTDPIEQESACGASTLIRRDVFYSIDGFDEQYYLYSEDDDFALKLRQAGWRIVFTPRATGIHEEHCSTSMTPNLNAVLAQSSAIFAKKWGWYFSKNPDVTKLGVFV